MDGTIILQGRFTSDGKAELIDLRSDVDWMEVINETQWATTQATGRGVKFEWYRGLAVGHAFELTKADNTNVTQAEKVISGGFTVLDGTEDVEAAVTGTTITKADPPVCTAVGHGYSDGDNVLLSNFVQMNQIANVVFTIGSVTDDTFELIYMDTDTANFTAETAFEVRRFPDFSWKNSWNTITFITKGNVTIIRLASDEPTVSYSVGDVLRFNVGPAFGMTEINGLSGKILAVNTGLNEYAIEIDSNSFTTFAWPNASAVPLTNAHVRLVGTTSNSVTGATTNVETIQMKLGAGIDGPDGSIDDIIYWKAGKSFSVINSLE